MLPLSLIVILAFLVPLGNCRKGTIQELSKYEAPSCRKHVASLVDFGGVGDGKTSNTKAFESAVRNLSQFANDGGSLLYVPPGKWVTGCFNVTSHFTLYLHRDAVILGSQVMEEWYEIDVLPSYGRGRDQLRRLCSLISGSNLTDVVITGNNGTIDGQGEMWWKKFRQNKLKVTRGYLMELLYSNQIYITYITLLNSPSWNVHPVYCNNVTVRGLTILAPYTSPNTDGINPDSCSNVLIEDCYVESGDDCVALKSGWDEYGIAFGMPTRNVTIRRLTCRSPDSAAIAIGSEMSGGVENVIAEDIVAVNTESGIRIKSAIGRGGYIRQIFANGMRLNTMKMVFWITGNYGSHADDRYDRNAITVVRNISYINIVAENVSTAGRLEGLEEWPTTGICLSNVTIGMAKDRKEPWKCTGVYGVFNSVIPPLCKDRFHLAHDPCLCSSNFAPENVLQLQKCALPKKN